MMDQWITPELKSTFDSNKLIKPWTINMESRRSRKALPAFSWFTILNLNGKVYATLVQTFMAFLIVIKLTYSDAFWLISSMHFKWRLIQLFQGPRIFPGEIFTQLHQWGILVYSARSLEDLFSLTRFKLPCWRIFSLACLVSAMSNF